jgi:phage terminase large subunit GpA-like protein
MSVPDWADRYRRLAAGAGANSGRWRTSKVEAARGPMMAITEPGVKVITLMVCTQLLKSSVLENAFGYYAHLDPSPILLVQPKEEAAIQFSVERIAPMIQASPKLRALIGGRKSRTSGNTLGFKRFPGGFLAMVGAGSPDNLARRPIRITLLDEVDKYAPTKEGDVIGLAEERLATFEERARSIRACSPTTEGESRIEASFAEGDQRRASIECPHCGRRQFLDFFKHVHWSKDEDTGEHLPDTAQVFCGSCGAAWSEAERLKALSTIRWHQTRPFTCCGQRQSPLDAYEALPDDHPDPVGEVWDWWEGRQHAVYRAKCSCCGRWSVPNEHASFQGGKLLSPWSLDRPHRIARKWLEAKTDEGLRQIFWNTQLGLPYRQRIGQDIKPDRLMDRREVWAGDVPFLVAILTAGVDVQPDRLEVEIVGWGRQEESWQIAYEVLEGDPDLPEVWERLDELLKRQWYRADGVPFTIMATCIDSGGANTQAVYNFCRRRTARRIWAIKGASETSAQRDPVWPRARVTRRRSRDYKPVIIGTNAAKDRISNCLALDAPGPGYMHFPHTAHVNYFVQLTGEYLKEVKGPNGTRRRVWTAKKNVAHEALDCRVYAYAALWGLFIAHGKSLDTEAERMGVPADRPPEVRVGTPEAQRLEANKAPIVPTDPPTPARTRRRRVIRSSFVNS